MARHLSGILRLAALLAAVCLWSSALARGVAESGAAQEILAAAGVQGGFVVHLGCGDGRLTAALGAARDALVVQGLDLDPAELIEAREHIHGLGRYGRVSVDRFDGEHLPYIDNLVNLLVGAKGSGLFSGKES